MIAQFLIDCGLYKQEKVEELRECVLRHIEFGTLTVLFDEKGLYAVARYNLEENGIIYVIDVGIREDRRSTATLKELIREGIKHNNKYKYLRFQRGFKNKPFKTISVEKMLRR